MKKILFVCTALVGIGAAVSFQNCSGGEKVTTNSQLASCIKVSNFNFKYKNTNPSFDVTAGGSSGSTCTNNSDYTTMTYDRAKDVMVLSGRTMQPKTFTLNVGSGGCSATDNGGDTWTAPAGSQLSTTIGQSSLNISFTGSPEISCSNVNL